jgi:amidophosphoribosyltransferase
MTDDDILHEECGIFGIYGDVRAAEFTFLGLHALQHRGQESSGMTVSDGKHLVSHRAMGLVKEAYDDGESIKGLKGHMAIGHNRYSTTGASNVFNIQPFEVNYKRGQLATAHNGNLTNTSALRNAMEEVGSIFRTTSDSELVLHLIARSAEGSLPEMIADALGNVEGAYSIVFLSNSQLIGVRDPRGFRPLCLGRIGEAFVLASETCAFDIVDAEYIREVEPGEVVVIDENGITSHFPFKKETPAACIFEYIYFARPDSKVYGENADKFRRRFGRQLADEHPVEADIVVAVPDSANTAGLGYSERSGVRYEIGLIRNHYVGRSFIDPNQSMREFKVKLKYNPVRGVIEGQRVILVDDSIVRGTTLSSLIRLLRHAGAKEVHVRVSSPPIKHPCFYGIDMQTSGELIAAKNGNKIEKIRTILGADTLGYLSIEGMVKIAKEYARDDAGYCTACFSGEYPVVPEDALNKLVLE